MGANEIEIRDFWVVGIGSSAGGLEALSAFVRELPPDANAAFVIAQHLAPHSKSMMTELLSRQTRLPVITAKDRMPIQPGNIYVIPPNYDATFVDNRIKLTRAGEETRPKPSVDVLLKSLATQFGRKAVGIILSGTGTDGAEGMREVKENGGVILSQDHLSAKYDGMPRAAQDLNAMDEVLPADELGARLTEILKEHADIETRLTSGEDDLLGDILEYLRQQTNTDFSKYKRGTIGRRIEKRISFLGMDSMRAYLERIQSDPLEVGALAQEMLVSVTSFFRDPEAFDALKPELERMLEEHVSNHEELRVWIAGCATGEEAYSIAILISELQRLRQTALPVKIFATDLDLEAVSYARAGVYTQQEVSGLPQQILRDYFEQKSKTYEVKKFIKDCVVFARQNLIQNPPFVKLDLISCRNVLIYFDGSLQQRVFEIFQYALKPGGILFLGKSENAPGGLFETMDRKMKVFRRLDIPSLLVPFVNRRHLADRDLVDSSGVKKVPPASASLDLTVPLQLLREYRLSAVVIDEEGSIFHTVGNLRRYLNFPEGLPDFRLTNLIPRTASVELAVLLRKSKKDGKPHRSRTHESPGLPSRSYRFVVRPLEVGKTAKKSLFLVSFEGIRRRKAVKVESGRKSKELTTEVIELRRELSTTKEHLQTLIEELEISNEELQSLNEELSSTNEELQASNEELETTNEELQASNEELVTVNEELNTKQAELKMSHLNLENIQNSIGAPLVVVDGTLRVTSFNKDAGQIFQISTTDIGRPIVEVACHCEIPDFERQIQATLLTGHTTETYCESQNNIFQVRIHPNRDERGKAIGAVVVFFNNTAIIQAQEKLRISDMNVRSLIDGSPAVITLRDTQGHYVAVNEAFRRLHGLEDSQIIGRSDRELFGDERADRIRDRDLEVVVKGANVEHEEIVQIHGAEHFFLSSRFPLQVDESGTPQVIGTVSVDITAQRQAQAELRTSESRYRAIVEDQAVLVCRHRLDGSLTFTNTAFCHFLGGSPESNIARSFYSFLDPKEAEKVRRSLAELTPEHSIVQHETSVHSASSHSLRWIRWIHRALFDDNANIIELQVVGFDVTEIHHQTNYLLQKEVLFTHVLEHTSDFLTLFKVDGRDFVVESFNPSAARSRTQGHHHLIGKRLDQLIDSSDSEYILEKYQECANTAGVVTFEEEIPTPRGPMHLLTTLVPILNRGETVDRIAALSRDITHLKRVEQALREQKRQADAANRAKSDFLAAMSHELRTPLGIISGMTQLLGSGPINSNQKKYISTIQQSCKSLLSLIEDVLDLSKIEAGKLALDNRAFRLDQMLEEVVQSFEQAAKLKNLEFKKDLQTADRVRLIGDQNRLRQVLVNLLGNAIKFTQQGSVELKVETTASDAEGYQILYAEVRDSGVGIPRDSFHRIFSRFSQADTGINRKFGGTGLGLAICKQLIEMMDGKIGFESEENKGSRFWFRVELPTASEDLRDQELEGERDYDFSDLNLLVVDDNFDSLELMQLFLAQKVKKLYATQDPQEAIEIAKREPIDLIIMDIQMPGMDGMETTRRIRQSNSPRADVPVIAVTANAMAGDRERYLKAGLSDYISKPVDFQGLYRKIDQWRDRRHQGMPVLYRR